MPQIDLSAEQKAALFKLNRKQEAALNAVHAALHRANRAGVWLYIDDSCQLSAIDARKIKNVQASDSLDDSEDTNDAQVIVSPEDNPNSFWAGEYMSNVGCEGIGITLKTKNND